MEKFIDELSLVHNKLVTMQRIRITESLSLALRLKPKEFFSLEAKLLSTPCLKELWRQDPKILVSEKNQPVRLFSDFFQIMKYKQTKSRKIFNNPGVS